MHRIGLIANKLHTELSVYKREEYLVEMGFRVIGVGCWKRVYGSDAYPFVVKLALDSGRKTGLNEVVNAKTAPSYLKPFLLPVLAWGEGFQIQERVVLRPCPASCSGDVDGMWDGEKHNHTHDEHGRLIIFDYGQDDQWEEVA